MVQRLLTEENVSMQGRFHSFEDVTILPRPTQKPRPNFWQAASSTDESFINTGRLGYGLMTFPREARQVKHWIELYRQAWRDAGHPGNGRVMIAFHMLCASTDAQAEAAAREPINAYMRSLVDANGDWGKGMTSTDYPNHPKMIENLRKVNFDKLLEGGGAWVGSPARIREQIARVREEYGGFEIASLQVNSHTISYAEAAASMKLFSEQVLPHFA